MTILLNYQVWFLIVSNIMRQDLILKTYEDFVLKNTEYFFKIRLSWFKSKLQKCKLTLRTVNECENIQSRPFAFSVLFVLEVCNICIPEFILKDKLKCT